MTSGKEEDCCALGREKLFFGKISPDEFIHASNTLDDPVDLVVSGHIMRACRRMFLAWQATFAPAEKSMTVLLGSACQVKKCSGESSRRSALKMPWLQRDSALGWTTERGIVLSGCWWTREAASPHQGQQVQNAVLQQPRIVANS